MLKLKQGHAHCLFQRFGNMAGIFQVMSVGVQAMKAGEVDSAFMSKLAKLATSEMISSKVPFFLTDL